MTEPNPAPALAGANLRHFATASQPEFGIAGDFVLEKGAIEWCLNKEWFEQADGDLGIVDYARNGGGLFAV